MLNSVVPELVVNDNITPLLIQKGAQDWKWGFWQDMADIVHMSMLGLASIWVSFNNLSDKKLIVSFDEGETFVEVTWRGFAAHLLNHKPENRRSVVVPAGVVTEISTQWSIAVTAVGKINRMLSDRNLGWEKWTKPLTLPIRFFRNAQDHYNTTPLVEIHLDGLDTSHMLFVNSNILDVELPETEEMVSILSSMNPPWAIIAHRTVDGKRQRVMVRNKLS